MGLEKNLKNFPEEHISLRFDRGELVVPSRKQTEMGYAPFLYFGIPLENNGVRTYPFRVELRALKKINSPKEFIDIDNYTQVAVNTKGALIIRRKPQSCNSRENEFLFSKEEYSILRSCIKKYR